MGIPEVLKVLDNLDNIKKVTRGEFLKTAGKVAALAVLPPFLTSSSPRPPEEQNRFIKTEFFKQVEGLAGKLGWRVRTTSISKEHMDACTVFHHSPDWTGCVDVFNGFDTGHDPATFKPETYLVYAWRPSDSDGHVMFTTEPRETLPMASGEFGAGDLLAPNEDEQRRVAKQFGFTYPDHLEDSLRKKTTPKDTIVPIGYWGLNTKEAAKLGPAFSMRVP